MRDSKQSEVKHLKVGDAYSYSLTVTNPESEVEVHTGVYTIATQHRENRDSKSYWKITPDEEKRCFDIYSFRDKKFLKKIKLWKQKENIGHISHAKFFGENNKKIFLVHSYKKCQISATIDNFATTQINGGDAVVTPKKLKKNMFFA